MTGGELITDAVLPLAVVSLSSDDSLTVDALVGTGFIVGSPQRLLTAKHVASLSDSLVGMLPVDGAWISVSLLDRRDHPSEDVTVYTVSPQSKTMSWFALSAEEQYATGEYGAFGYPEEVYYEGSVDLNRGRVLPRPSLIYGAGVVRRRVSSSMPSIIGSSFLELSDTLGLGCSGGPVFVRNAGGTPLKVVGVYNAERTIEVAGRQPRTVAYATRIASIAPWLREQGCAVI